VSLSSRRAARGQRPLYAAGIARKAQFMFDQNMHELGYIVLKNSHQGSGLSKMITDKLLSLFQGKPLFAITSNERMRTSLGKRGFAQQGTSWPNRKGEPITLWIRP
jgi:hypothetical protein